MAEREASADLPPVFVTAAPGLPVCSPFSGPFEAVVFSSLLSRRRAVFLAQVVLAAVIRRSHVWDSYLVWARRGLPGGDLVRISTGVIRCCGLFSRSAAIWSVRRLLLVRRGLVVWTFGNMPVCGVRDRLILRHFTTVITAVFIDVALLSGSRSSFLFFHRADRRWSSVRQGYAVCVVQAPIHCGAGFVWTSVVGLRIACSRCRVGFRFGESAALLAAVTGRKSSPGHVGRSGLATAGRWTMLRHSVENIRQACICLRTPAGKNLNATLS